MSKLNRRDFIRFSGTTAACGVASRFPLDFTSINKESYTEIQKSVNFIGDGLELNPMEYSSLLVRLAEEGKIEQDFYSIGGATEELEHKFAQWLGKESAIFLPTGTLANHLAIRQLAGEEKKAIVQADSHIYMDTGDCVQRLSGINLIPCAPGKATVTLEETKELVDKAALGLAGATKIGVISIESPVRRKYEEIFDFDEMKRISAFARKEGIRLHLDGARLFCASACTGILPSQYSALFDTVYISLYKCFNAGAGAILAGPRIFIESLAHLREMFGGSMLHAWQFAAIAHYYVDDFIQEQRNALKAADSFFKEMEKNSVFRIEKIPKSANAFKLHIMEVDLQEFRKKLSERNIYLRPPRKDWTGFMMKINASLNRNSVEALARIFVDCL